MTDAYPSVSLTSATLDQTTVNFTRVAYGSAGIVPGLGVTNVVKVGPRRVSVSVPTNIFLVGFTDFTVSTMNTAGGIKAVCV
jgi:hypothetical protein